MSEVIPGIGIERVVLETPREAARQLLSAGFSTANTRRWLTSQYLITESEARAVVAQAQHERRKP